MNSVKRLSLVTAALASGMTLASVALAADAVIESDAVPSPTPEAIFQRSLLIGGGAGFEPLYEGSGKYRAISFPIISHSSGEGGPRRFEFRSLDDNRFHALRYDNFSVGPIAGYRFGRDESDSARLRGLGDVDGGLVLGGFASYEFYKTDDVTWGADFGISTQVTGDAFVEERFAGVTLPVNVRNRLGDGYGYGYGYEIDFGLSGEYAIDERLNFATRIGAIYASEEYMRTYFGVISAQAISAYAAGNAINTFDADAGIKNVYANFNPTYDLTCNIQLRAGAGYSRLLNNAADGPITEDKTSFPAQSELRIEFGFDSTSHEVLKISPTCIRNTVLKA